MDCDDPGCWCWLDDPMLLMDLPRPAFRWSLDAPVGCTSLGDIEDLRAGRSLT